MKDFIPPPQLPLRPPSEVMRLSRMGCMFANRLSFLRTLTRALAQHGTAPDRTLWQMDADGYGRAVFSRCMAIPTRWWRLASPLPLKIARTG